MKYILSIFLFVSLYSSLNAQDFLAGVITVRNIGVDSIEATINIYTEVNSNVDNSSTIIYWGDGQLDTLYQTDSTFISADIICHRYKGIHVYYPFLQIDNWIISTKSYQISNTVNNWSNSQNISLGMSFLKGDGFPTPTAASYTSAGILSIGSSDSTGVYSHFFNVSSFDSLHYRIIPPNNFFQYTLPDSIENFHFDNTTQTLIWDKPTQTGKFLLPIEIQQESYHSTVQYFVLLDVKNITSSYEIELTPFVLKCFPNPTSETLQITTDSPVDEIQIYNSIGQQVWQGQGFRENQVRVNVRDFSQGMYIVRVRQGESWVSEQVLVSR
jgi:hypothetical protein